MNGPREGERIEINDAQEIIVGRDETADVVFKDDLVSRRHVKFRRDWAGTHVEDLGSRNGIKVNKKKVNRKQVKDGDEIEVGTTRLLYVDPTDLQESNVVLPNSGEHEAVAVGDDDDEHTQSLPSGRVATRRAKAKEDAAPKEEPPKEEPPKEEAPAPEPAPEEAAPEPEPQPEPMPDPPPEPFPDPALDEPAAAGGLDKSKMVPLALMGLFALFALGLIIAVLAGA
jgi:pSer/pThr/pTyr-binding forkhead associated (FHA) protein